MARILVLRWQESAYDSLGGLLEVTARELAAEGHDIALLPVGDADWGQRLLGVLGKGGFALALTMSGVGSDLTVDGGKLIWEAANVPLFNWCCDHPCYFPSRAVIRNRFLLHGYVFPDHARYNIEHFNPNGMAFGVHIGTPPRGNVPGGPLPLTERNGRIIFSKSGQDHNAIEARWRSIPALQQRILFAAGEELLHRNTAEFLPVLQQICGPMGLMLSGSSEVTTTLLRELDAYVRYRRGNLVMQTLLPYPVDVYGTGWDHIAWAGARARFHGSTTWQATMQALPRYLACLSINPLVDESVHDRVFYALTAGVVPLTDSNAFIRANAPALQPYTFDFTRERITEAAEALLADPAAALERTELAWQAMQPEFSARASARQILQFAVLQGGNGRWGA